MAKIKPKSIKEWYEYCLKHGKYLKIRSGKLVGIFSEKKRKSK